MAVCFPSSHSPATKLSLHVVTVQTSNKLLHKGSKGRLFNQRDNAKAQEGTVHSVILGAEGWKMTHPYSLFVSVYNGTRQYKDKMDLTFLQSNQV